MTSGQPVPHNRPTVGLEEQNAVTKVLASAQLSQASQVRRFEEEFAESLGADESAAVAVGNGTAALFLALWVLGARDRDVLFPVYTCSSLRHATAMAGARQVRRDIKAGSPNLDVDLVSDCDIAIIPHMYGLPIRLPSSSSGIAVVEDAAQALGARVDGIPVGLQTEVGVFSFYATKLITTAGQGGMLVSRNAGLVGAVRDYLDFDCRRDDRNRFNFQMTDVQAAMGRVQLRQLPLFLERREEIFRFYKDMGLQLLDVPSDEQALQAVRYRTIWVHESAAAIVEGLRLRGIEAINPLERWELLGAPEEFPEAARLSEMTVSLPCYPTLTDDQLHRIRSAVDEVRLSI